MLAHFVASWGYVGLSWGQCGPILGYVGLSWKLCGPILGLHWPMLSQKSRKMGTTKNHFKTQDIWTVGGLSWGYVGPSWDYVGLSWGQCGPILGVMLAHLRARLAHLQAMLAHLGAMLAQLGAMLAHLEPYSVPICALCWPMLTYLEPQEPKNGNKREAHKTP